MAGPYIDEVAAVFAAFSGIRLKSRAVFAERGVKTERVIILAVKLGVNFVRFASHAPPIRAETAFVSGQGNIEEMSVEAVVRPLVADAGPGERHG